MWLLFDRRLYTAVINWIFIHVKNYLFIHSFLSCDRSWCEHAMNKKMISILFHVFVFIPFYEIPFLISITIVLNLSIFLLLTSPSIIFLGRWFYRNICLSKWLSFHSCSKQYNLKTIFWFFLNFLNCELWYSRKHLHFHVPWKWKYEVMSNKWIVYF